MFRRPWAAAWGFSPLAASMSVAVGALLLAAPAFAGPGYALDQVKPSFATAREVPRGIAIDQTSQQVYVTELVTDRFAGGPGQIEQFDANGNPTVHSPFATGGEDFFAGVAVNPVSHGIYAYQVQLVTAFGTFGTAEMNTFSSTGSPGISFTPSKSKAPQLAADAAGRVYLPNDSTSSVQIFSSTGTLEGAIPCTGCPGGAFVEPTSVAIDSSGNLYVVDLASGSRVVKFKPSGGSYAYDSLLQSGSGAAAVGVDPSSNDVFVGELSDDGYHIVAYDSGGTQFDDFGAGVLAVPPLGAVSGGQIAVNATTRKLYVADSGANKVWIFDRIASIPAPTASTDPATEVGQLEADLNSTVNPQGHGLTKCQFEYTTSADFGINAFANALTVPCAPKPVGSVATSVLTHLKGLTPTTEYSFRIVVASNGGSTSGTVRSFTTLPSLPPTAATGVASPITQTAASVAGTVNPRGGLISSCQFEYTIESSFQEHGFANASSVKCAENPSGATSKPVAAKLTSLTPATRYRFRVSATNNSGTVNAPDQSFTTLADTCQTNPSLCSPPEEDLPPPSTSPPSQPPATRPAKPLKCRKGFKKKKVHGKTRCVKLKKKR